MCNLNHYFLNYILARNTWKYIIGDILTVTNGWDNQPNDHIIRTMQELSDSVKKLTHSVESMSSSGGSSRVHSRNADETRLNQFIDRVSQVMRDVLPKKKNGELYSATENKLSRLLEQYRNDFEQIYKITTYGYNRDNPNNRVNPASTDLALELTNRILSNFDGVRGFQNNPQQNRQALSQGHDLALVKDTYRYQPAEGNNHEAIVRYTGTLSQVRDAVVAQTTVLNNIHQALTNNNSVQSSTNHTQVNNSLNAIAANSKLVRDALKSLEKSVNKSTSAVDKFYDKIKTTATNLTTINRRLSGSATSLQNIGKKLSGVSKSLNGTQKKLGAIGSASASSKNNSFREQATRNSDRAKQAGFIALLIPALAKLLKKSPMTDLLKLMFLRLGKNHPFLAAAGIMAAPMIPSVVLAPMVKKLVSSFFGLGALKGATKVAKTTSKSGIPVSKWWEFRGGFIEGLLHSGESPTEFNQSRARRVHNPSGYAPGVKGRYVSGIAKGLPRIAKDPTNFADQGYLTAGKYARASRGFFRHPYKNFLKALGKGSKGIPLLGTALSAAFEIPDLIKAKKTGNKNIMHSQMAKSIGGVVGGAGGAAVGGALGGLLGFGVLSGITTPIGAAIGGVLGDKLGRGLGGLTEKVHAGFAKAAKQAEEASGWRTGFGKAVIDIWTAIKMIFTTIWEKIKNLPIFDTPEEKAERKNDKTLRSDVEKKVSQDKKNLAKDKNKVKKDEEIFLNAVDFKEKGDKGKWWAKERAYNGLMEGFTRDYVHSKVGEWSKGWKNPETGKVETTKGYYDYINKYKKEHQAELNKYKEQRWKQYRNTEAARIKREKTRLENSSIGNVSKTAENIINATSGSVTFSGGTEGKGTFFGHNVTSAYGYRIHPTKGGIKFHDGIDLDFKEGQKVGAYTGGKIAKIGWEKGYGNVVVVESQERGRKVYHRYAHLQGAAKGLKVGQSVGVGSLLGYAGHTGGRYAPHLHYEERWDSMWGKSRNPMVSMTSSFREYNENLKKSKAEEASNKKAITETAELGSGIREAFRELVGGGKGGSSKQDRTRNIVLSAVDVTGSLGVWGITQYNNGVMSK